MSNQIPQFTTMTGKTLMSQPIEPIGFTVDSILPHGLFILSGSAKIGKSWLALDLCRAVSSGGLFWHYPAVQGEVLYLALEDNPIRIRGRLSKIAPEYDPEAVTDIHFVYRSHKLGEGLAEQLTAFLDKHPRTKLIVIDTLQYIRNTGKFTGTYSGDYHDMDTLREIIKGRKLTMLLITHNHKSDANDPLNKVYGSAGLTGAVDGIFVLEKNRRGGNTAKLTIANRDTDEYQFDIRFDRLNCRWQYIAEVSGDGDEHEQLYDLLNLLLDETPSWSGTSTQLSIALHQLDPAFSISPVILSKALKTHQEILTQHGIDCSFTRSNTTRTIQLIRSQNEPETDVTKVAV